MSVLFKDHFSFEGQERSSLNRHQYVRRIGEKDKRGRDESLLVFGYACNVYRDDEKALYFEEKKHLIPWMGDQSLMIDRFDGRLLLEDISPYISSASSSNCNLSQHELEVERLCDEERYRSLEAGDESDNEYEEEEMKRFKAAIALEGSYSAVGLNYDFGQYNYAQYSYDSPQVDDDTSAQYYATYSDEQTFGGGVEQVSEEHERPPEAPVVEQLVHSPKEIEEFIPPAELDVPDDMAVPDTAKQHAIIERTAFFIKDHGPQMEIVVKAKQSGNPQFDFLEFDNRLNPYYKLMLNAVRSGSYTPVITKAASPPPQEEEESEDESDDEVELHPLLTASLRTPIVSSKKQASVVEPPPLPPGWTAVNPDASDGHSSGTTPDTAFRDINLMSPTQVGPSGFSVYPQSQPPIPLAPTHGDGLSSTMDSETAQGRAQVFHALSFLTYPDNGYGLPIIPPPPDLKPICDKLAEYVARNGKQFEENIRAKNDPRFDFINETSDHYTYYLTKIREYEANPNESAKKGRDGKSGVLVPSAKPVSFQIKTKETKGKVMEYQSNILYKTAKADESDEEGDQEDNGKNCDKKESQNGENTAARPGVHGPKTEEDVIAEERATKLKEEKEKEVQRLEEEAKSTTSSLRRQVQLERRRRAQLFINMLKKTKPGASEQASSASDKSNTSGQVK